MARLTVSLLALALGAVAAVALVSCGGRDESGLLPGDTASEIVDNLDNVQASADAGDCETAIADAQTVQNQINALPASVDPKLKENLSKGAATLASVAADCQATTPETTEPTTETTEPTTTETTSSTETTTTGKTNTETTTSTSTTQPTTPTTTTTPTTPPTGGTGTGGTGQGRGK